MLVIWFHKQKFRFWDEKRCDDDNAGDVQSWFITNLFILLILTTKSMSFTCYQLEIRGVISLELCLSYN